MFWDFLYRLTERDATFPQLVYAQLQGSDSGLKTPCQVILIPKVPSDQIFVVFSCSAVAVPGAAQTIDNIELNSQNVNEPARGFNVWLRDIRAPAALVATPASLTQQAPLVIPPGYRLQVSANFSGAAANNQLTANATGIYLPRGNFSLP